ncbi:COG4223 family protein [Rhodoplanes azumiensis]|uniref:Inner membrane protein n=1 Tax=Rhodoplanes azumiensis TaxID=1897628 RepID=A0ABW5AS78_9BRAD
MADPKTPPADKPDNPGPPPSEGNKARAETTPSPAATTPIRADSSAGAPPGGKPGAPTPPASQPTVLHAQQPAKPGAAQPSVGQPATPSPAAAKPAAPVVTEAKPAETKPAAAKPAETKVAETKAGPDATRPAPGRTREDTAMARSTPAPTNWGSLFAAGLVGGAVVAAAGAAWLTYNPLDAGGDGTAAKLAKLELQVADLAQRPAPTAQLPADVAGRLGRVEAAVAAAARQANGDPAVAARLTAAEAAVAKLTDQLARAERRIEETAKAGAGVAAPAAPGVQPAELDAVAARADAAGTKAATVERNLTALQQQVTQRANAPVADKTVRLAVITAALRGLVERGAPYASELAAAKQLVSDPQTFAPLEPFAATGVPSALVLGRELSEVAPAMLKAGDLPAGDDYLDRLQSQAEKLVRWRPVKDQPASDLAAQIGRAEAKARQADLAGALVELAKLPPAVRAPAEPWIKKAEARQAAVAAAQRVSSGALTALATP